MQVRPPRASRRTLAGGVGAVTALAAAGSAAAAPERASYAPARYRGGPKLLSTQDRHLVSRFSYGVTPGLAAEVRRAGGGRAWFEAQLDPSSVPDAAADDLVAWWPSLQRGPWDLWKRQIHEVEGIWEVMEAYQRWVLMRRLRSRRQVLEVMTELWENHFNVPVNGDAQGTWRKRYGDQIRSHALGRFEDLLQATTTHPALLISLDNVSSTAEHPNENLGRELLELHTVGRGHYTEDDVKGSARILTGWTVDMWDTFAARYDKYEHYRGPVTVMDFHAANRSAEGQQVARDYLTYLAHHPATARRVATKLAVKFVSDTPSDALLSDLAEVYLTHDTQIRPVLRALVRSAEFRTSVGGKVRDPGEDLIASYRAFGLSPTKPPVGEAGGAYAATVMVWQASSLGTAPFAWPRPDGQPITNEAWATPSRVLASMSLHTDISGGWWPSKGVTYRTPAEWVPEFPIRFDMLVDHLSQQLLHRRSTAPLLEACCLAVDLPPDEKITRAHGLVKWNMVRLLTTFLDSPAFLTR
ncbi:DUF1800 domain-containing protein [Nocardioides sp. CN2-186]|uniref:DUF1800 domain-containing protein n=1 Tax=Nocardioides tweenelious TaxID=3156607 RepID=UPI0032B4000A